MNQLKYITGDATLPLSERVIITHCCNDIGGWGAGFVIPLANRYPQSREEYRRWYNTSFLGISYVDDRDLPVEWKLGEAQFVKIDEGYIVNILGQRSIGFDEFGNAPIRYDAIRKGMQTICQEALYENYSVQLPKIGAGLAGGNWDIIEQIIIDELVEKGVDTTVILL